ncbi:MAG: hypothetical protein WC087_00130 [Candidatus Paceibacterota bacterium]
MIKQKIMRSDYSYPLLEQIAQLYKTEEKTFENVYLLACQHILSPQAKMFELINKFGIPKENIHIFGKIYSTNNEVLKELRVEGFNVSDPIFNSEIPFDTEHYGNCKKEFNAFISSIKSSSRIIILDDGGELLKVANELFEIIPSGVSVVGVEQTSSGFRKLENAEHNFPIFNVARSAIKLTKESPIIADIGCKRIVGVISQYSIDARILLVGLGPLGSSILSWFKENKYFTLGYDIANHDKTELLDLIQDNNINLIIGVTGSNILDESTLQNIKKSINHNLYLISMSSSDREFPAVYMRKNVSGLNGIHADIKWDNIVLINNGFPITFKGNRYESTPQEIERTIALLLGSVMEAAITDEIKSGFLDVPVNVAGLL